MTTQRTTADLRHLDKRYVWHPFTHMQQWLADARTFDVLEALERYAEERGVSLLEVAIGGLAAMPGVASVIAGATRPEQVRANAAAANWQPSADEITALRDAAH